MQQAVWWSYELDGMPAMPELTLQQAKSRIQPLPQLILLALAPVYCMQLIMQKHPRPLQHHPKL